MLKDPRLNYLEDIFRITRDKFGRFVWRMATGTLRREASVGVSMTPVWNLGYAPDMARGARLYDVAKQKSWDPRRDIAWEERQSPRELAIAPDYFLALHLDVDDLVDEETLVRLSHAEVSWTLSQILHGEQGALMLCSQLINVHREMDGKLFLASQAMDEARHIEVFNRYLRQQGRVYPIDFGVKFVVDAFLSTDNWRKQAIGMLVLVEGYALGSFAVIQSNTTDPVLDELLTYVMRDEGRHVGFGLAAIRDSMDELSEEEQQEIEDYAFHLVRSVAFTRNSEGGFRDICRLYWNHLGPHIHRRLSFEELESTIADHPHMHEFNNIVFEENLLPNLDRLGLLSERVRPRYESIGLSIDRYLA